MNIGAKVVIVLRNVDNNRRVTGKVVHCAKVMRTGKQNFQRVRVRIEGSKSTGWIHPDEEGVEWARGWYTTDAKVLCALVAMERT